MVYQDGVKLAESDSHIVHTSSIRMELEAIRQALMWLKEKPPNCGSIINATDFHGSPDQDQE